jgi:hypothetical protein
MCNFRGIRDYILLPQILDFPNLDGQVPVFISPRNRVVQLYPRALGSLFFASYDSQGYGGGIRTRSHTSLANLPPPCSLYSLDTDRIGNTVSNSSIIVAYIPSVAILVHLVVTMQRTK